MFCFSDLVVPLFICAFRLFAFAPLQNLCNFKTIIYFLNIYCITVCSLLFEIKSNKNLIKN